MKKLLSIILATLFCFISYTTAFAYDGPVFPKTKAEKNWKYFNPETAEAINFRENESPCPYRIQIHVSDMTYNDTTVSIYAYYEPGIKCEGTWICDDLGHTIDVNLETYEGSYFSDGIGVIINLSNGISILANADGFEIAVRKYSGFQECPYDSAMLIAEDNFCTLPVDVLVVKVFSYTYDGEPGVWMTDSCGNIIDFRGAGYFATVSNHTIQLVDGGKNINVYPSSSGFNVQLA